METKTSWLNYSKMILEKVSFDTVLFIKELNKALKVLNQEDILKLELWCYERFNIKLSLEAVKAIEKTR